MVQGSCGGAAAGQWGRAGDGAQRASGPAPLAARTARCAAPRCSARPPSPPRGGVPHLRAQQRGREDDGVEGHVVLPHELHQLHVLSRGCAGVCVCVWVGGLSMRVGAWAARERVPTIRWGAPPAPPARSSAPSRSRQPATPRPRPPPPRHLGALPPRLPRVAAVAGGDGDVADGGVEPYVEDLGAGGQRGCGRALMWCTQRGCRPACTVWHLLRVLRTLHPPPSTHGAQPTPSPPARPPPPALSHLVFVALQRHGGAPLEVARDAAHLEPLVHPGARDLEAAGCRAWGRGREREVLSGSSRRAGHTL